MLLKKLHHYGIRNKNLSWFISYLHNRRQHTIIGNVTSDVNLIITGVPQGSTLVPILFLLFINGTVESSRVLCFTLFADDTNVTLSNTDVVSLTRTLNTELELASFWLICN